MDYSRPILIRQLNTRELGAALTKLKECDNGRILVTDYIDINTKLFLVRDTNNRIMLYEHRHNDSAIFAQEQFTESLDDRIYVH